MIAEFWRRITIVTEVFFLIFFSGFIVMLICNKAIWYPHSLEVKFGNASVFVGQCFKTVLSMLQRCKDDKTRTIIVRAYLEM